MISKKTLIDRLDDLLWVIEVENEDVKEYDGEEIMDLLKEAKLFCPEVKNYKVVKDKFKVIAERVVIE